MIFKIGQFSAIWVAMLFGACTFSEEIGTDEVQLQKGNYVFPTTTSELGYQEPQSYDDLPAVPECDVAREKALQNYNEYMTAWGEATGEAAGLIGDSLFVKADWCHPDLSNSDNFVVVTMIGDESQIALDKELGKITSGPLFFTFFDKKNDIIKWSY